MRKWLALGALPLLALGGILAGIALSVGETTGTNTATAVAIACKSNRCNTVTATHTVTFTIPTVTETATGTTTSPPPPPPPGCSGCYWNQSFDGDLNLATTQTSTWPYYRSWTNASGGGCGVADFSFNSGLYFGVPGFSNQSAALKIDPAIQGNPRAQGCSNPSLAVAVAMPGGNGQLYNGALASHTGQGETSWYRLRFKVPDPGFTFCGVNSTNWGGNLGSPCQMDDGVLGVMWEWHEQCGSTGFASGCPTSMTAGFANYDYHDGDPSTYPPQLYVHVAGGNVSAPRVEWYFTSVDNRLSVNTWHDLVYAYTWDTLAGGTGNISIWLDGQVFPGHQRVNDSYGRPTSGPAWVNNYSFPTLWSDSSGHVDKPSHGIYNYRDTNGLTAETDFDEWLVGPTAASVGFTP